MRTELGRRAFVGSAMVGVPLLAGGGAALWAQSDAGVISHVHTGPDLIREHVIRELLRSVNDAKRRGIRGEDVRALAAQLRTLALYDQQTGRNEEVRRQLSNLVAERGREAVLAMQPDRVRQQEELRKLGVEWDLSDFERLTPSTPEGRARALDMLLERGPSGAWDQVAKAFAAGAATVDVRAGGVLSVRQQLEDYTWCEMLRDCKDVIEVLAALFCPFEAWFGATAAECAAVMIVGAALALLILLSACL
jgi:hypothetical protein